MDTGSSDSPMDVAASTRDANQGDVADLADRLSMVMEAEAVRNARIPISTDSTNRSPLSPRRTRRYWGSIRTNRGDRQHVIGSSHVRRDPGAVPRGNRNDHPQST